MWTQYNATPTKFVLATFPAKLPPALLVPVTTILARNTMKTNQMSSSIYLIFPKHGNNFRQNQPLQNKNNKKKSALNEE